MKDVVGSYEADAVPRSLMTPDDTLHAGHIYKNQIIESLTKVYDAMIEAQKIANAKNNMKRVKTCKGVSKLFINSITNASQGYDEVPVVFDDYHPGLIEEPHSITSNNRFLIEDRTVIRDGTKELICILNATYLSRRKVSLSV